MAAGIGQCEAIGSQGLTVEMLEAIAGILIKLIAYALIEEGQAIGQKGLEIGADDDLARAGARHPGGGLGAIAVQTRGAGLGGGLGDLAGGFGDGFYFAFGKTAMLSGSIDIESAIESGHYGRLDRCAEAIDQLFAGEEITVKARLLETAGPTFVGADGFAFEDGFPTRGIFGVELAGVGPAPAFA